MAALAIVVIVSIFSLSLLLAGFGAQSITISAALAVVVMSPLFFLGSALLYLDQKARLESAHNDGGEAMPVYIMLSSLTAQGVQTLKSNPDRLREVNHDVEELGAKVLHQWATLGPFDFVNVVEAPDAATIARVSVALGARGSAKLQTLTALEIEEFLGAVS